MSTDNSKGIDVEEALSILSARTADSSSSKAEDGCGCHGTKPPENAKNMGQKIDLLARKETGNEQEEQKISEEKIQQERAKRHEEIQKELNNMGNSELLQALLKAQEDRVKAYQEYESGLVTVLRTGNMTSYPETALKATASFSFLSETVKAIQTIMETRQEKEISNPIKQLQGLEKEKLHLTAAHHLERIRLKNEGQQPNKDPRTMKLLEDGVASLQRKIATCIGNINECIDEIRCLLIDMDD